MVIDCKNKQVGYLAQEIARELMGHNRLVYNPNLVDHPGARVVNVGALKVNAKKKYYSHTGYPGGFRAEFAPQLLKRNPRLMLKKAI